MTKRFFSLVLFFSLLCGWVSAENVISDYTERKVNEFVTLRVALKSEEDSNALRKITAIRDDALLHLKENALDFEQENCILSSMYFMEIYEHTVNTLEEGASRAVLRAEMKSNMQKNMACIDARKKGAVSKWLYLFAGDVTAYYMTRSLAATLFYGFKVKGFYEKAIESDESFAPASVCLGNWLFFAPGVFGGKKKAQKYFDAALKSARTDGERYMAYIANSQINFEGKNKEIAAEYLQKAVDLGLGHKELDIIARCNEKGYSHFQYMRNRSGIDEELSEDEKDEND